MSRIGKVIPYESVLGGLNVFGQRGLSDRVNRVIDLPVGNVNPPDAGYPAKGRFLQGDNGGCLLTDPFLSGYKDFELWQELGWSDPAVKTVTFSRKVKGVLALAEVDSGSGLVWWARPFNYVEILRLTNDTMIWMPFRGTSFLLYRLGTPTVVYNIYFWGFY